MQLNFLTYAAQIRKYPKSRAPPASGKAKANTIYAEYTLWLKCSYTSPKTAQKAETAKYAHAVFIYDFLSVPDIYNVAHATFLNAFSVCCGVVYSLLGYGN